MGISWYTEEGRAQLGREAWRPPPSEPANYTPESDCTAYAQQPRAKTDACRKQLKDQLIHELRKSLKSGRFTKKELARRMWTSVPWLSKILNDNNFDKDHWIPCIMSALDLEVQFVLKKGADDGNS